MTEQSIRIVNLDKTSVGIIALKIISIKVSTVPNSYKIFAVQSDGSNMVLYITKHNQTNYWFGARININDCIKIRLNAGDHIFKLRRAKRKYQLSSYVIKTQECDLIVEPNSVKYQPPQTVTGRELNIAKRYNAGIQFQGIVVQVDPIKDRNNRGHTQKVKIIAGRRLVDVSVWNSEYIDIGDTVLVYYGLVSTQLLVTAFQSVIVKTWTNVMKRTCRKALQWCLDCLK